MVIKKWKVGQPDKETAKFLAAECEIDPFAALIACSRGITDPSDLELMLSNEPMLSDPFEMVDMAKAADCVNEAIENGTQIAVFGDYDCDGVVATALMFNYLSERGAKGIVYIPDRIVEGYGMNRPSIDYLKSQDIGLIITVDNGISSAAEIAYAKTLGIKTVVTDHHIPPDVIPDKAEAVVDPHRKDCPSSFKNICGAVVAFKLICALENKPPEQILYKYADMLAVATIGDVMPLVDENRSIVKMGIYKLRTNPATGLAAIMNSSGMDKKKISALRVAYTIVPRINAAGRVGSALEALKIFFTEDILEALNIANNLDSLNDDRKRVEHILYYKALSEIEQFDIDDNRIIVVVVDNEAPGVVGIVAARIMDKYGKPTIVLYDSDTDLYQGSGRSISGINLYEAIKNCDDLLFKYGGHELAAGLSLKWENIEPFIKRVNEYASKFPRPYPEVCIDFKLNPAALSVDLADSIKVLEPYGTGNRQPLFGLMDVKLEHIEPIKQGKHLKLSFSKGDSHFKALLFNQNITDFPYDAGDFLDLAVNIDSDFFNYERVLSVTIKEIRYSGMDQDSLFADVENYFSFKEDKNYNAELLLPSRQQVGTIYKLLLKNSSSEEKIINRFLKEIGYGKTKTALDVLCELELIIKEKEILRVNINKSNEKTNLMNSHIYKKLFEEVNKA